MADPLLTVNEYVADGVTTLYNINFTGGYISRDHVQVHVYDNANYENPVVPAFTFISDYVIQITPATTAGKVVRIQRVTPNDLPLVDFSDGSIVNEANLDENAKQSVFLAAEYHDALTLSGISADLVAATLVTVQAAADTVAADKAIVIADMATVAGYVTTTSGYVTAASDSATAAQGYSVTAGTYATTAQGYRDTANSSATAASGYAANALSAKTAAEAARDVVLAAFADFDTRYLGALSADPTLGNEGEPLVAGMLYFNTTSSVMMVYTGSLWVAAYVSGGSFLAIANNLSDLGNKATARTNLGVAIGSNVQAWSATLDSWALKTVPSGTIADLSTVQTFTNKTLTTPKISQISNTGTLTLPTSTDTLVGRATTDTLTNKTLTAPTIATINNGGTLTLPTGADTLVGRATTDTLTNKTLSSPTVTGYTETQGTITGTAFAPNLANATVYNYITSGNATLTVPAAAVGKSFSARVNYGGAHSLTVVLTGTDTIEWPGGTAPTYTGASGKSDVLSFICFVAGKWSAVATLALA